ncbi:MAG: DUF2062 domain-containing protein [Acidobacteriota bacterium]|nr:DUF2062 domain-containing protein [Acidobacteriota bacterium]
MTAEVSSCAVGGGISVWVVIPVYNNAKTIHRTARGALRTGLPVIVVDDGSSDGSAGFVDGLPVTCIRHNRNRGKGAAILTGALQARKSGATHLVVIDADGQFECSDLPIFMAAIVDSPHTIFCGYRDFTGSGAPRSSVFGRAFSNFWVRVIGGIHVDDSQCGLRAYPIGTLLELGVRARRFDFEVEVLVRAGWAGICVASIPVRVDYSPPEGRTTSFRPFIDNARITWTYTRLFLRNFVPWPHRRISDPGGKGSVDEREKSFALLRRLLQEHRTPGELAAAVAVGLFLATLPLIGVHSIAIVYAATVLRLNRALAFAVSHLCAPPVVPALCLEAGYFLRNGRWLTEASIELLWLQAGQRFFDYLLGTLVVAPFLALLGALVTLFLARAIACSGEACERSHHGRNINATYGTELGIGIFKLIIKTLGLRAAYSCLLAVVPFYLLCRPAIRQSMRPYLAHRFPGRSRFSYYLLSGRWLWEFGETLVDQAALEIRGNDFFVVEAERSDELEEILARNQGTIFLMTHMGRWMLASSFLEMSDKALHLLMHNDGAAPSGLLSASNRRTGAVHHIDPDGLFGGLLEARAALLRGDYVGMMGDRAWGGRTVCATFLGGVVRVPESPFRLAAAGDAGLIALIVEKVRHRYFRVRWKEIIPGGDRSGPEDSVGSLAMSYMDFVENATKKSPFAWFNHSDFWEESKPERQRGRGE